MGFENGKLVRVVMRAFNATTGDQQVNTLHYDLQDSLLQTDNDPQSLADAFRDAVVPKYRTIYSSAWTIQPVEVVEEKDPQNPDTARSAWVSGVAVAGTRVLSGDLLPSACCAVATLPTNHIGRRHRGRMFLGGDLLEADQAAGRWGSVILGLWQALLDAIPHQPDLATGTSDSTANWAVYSRTSRAADVDPYASHVTAPILRNDVHWLRSRRT